MFDSILSVFGRNDVAGLPPVLDLFLAGPQWLTVFYPLLVIIGSLLVAHLVATKRLPVITKQPISKTFGLPIAAVGLGLSVFTLQSYPPSQPHIWQSGLWQLCAALVAVGTVMLVTIMDLNSIRRYESGPQVHRREHLRSPVKIVWYVVATLAIYLGLTIGVAALGNEAAPRPFQYAIIVLGVVWLLSLLFNFADNQSVDVDEVYPPAFWGKSFGRPVSAVPAEAPFSRYTAFSDDADRPSGRTRAGLDDLGFNPTPSDVPPATTGTYRTVADTAHDLRVRPDTGWDDDATYGGGAQRIDPVEPVAPSRPVPPPVAPAAPPRRQYAKFGDDPAAPRRSGQARRPSGGDTQSGGRRYDKF